MCILLNPGKRRLTSQIAGSDANRELYYVKVDHRTVPPVLTATQRARKRHARVFTPFARAIFALIANIQTSIATTT